MPLRILYALHTVDPKAAGLTEDVLLLSAAHRSLKHRIEILTFDAPGTSWLLELGMPVHRVGGKNPHRVASRQFLQWLREHAAGYDCVLVSGVAGFNAFRAWQILREVDAPYFIFAPRHLGFLSGLPKQFEKWKQRLCWLWGGYPLFRDAHAIFFSSEEARRKARQAFWPYDCHEFLLTCGVPGPPAGVADAARDEFFAGHPALLGKRIFTVFADESGNVPKALLGAVRTLLDTGRWERGSMRLLIAGGTDDARAMELHNLGDIVTLVGKPLDRERWGMLQASEALLQPTHRENSDWMVTEAFSVGTPVLIARGVNLWREVMLHAAGFAGEDTVDGYADLFTHWFDQSPAERAAMRTHARQGFETHFSEQAAANTLTAVAYLLIGASRANTNSIAPEIFRNQTDFL